MADEVDGTEVDISQRYEIDLTSASSIRIVNDLTFKNRVVFASVAEQRQHIWIDSVTPTVLSDDVCKSRKQVVGDNGIEFKVCTVT